MEEQVKQVEADRELWAGRRQEIQQEFQGFQERKSRVHQEAEEPEDPVAEQLQRINWSLKQVLIVLVFLMLIIALK